MPMLMSHILIVHILQIPTDFIAMSKSNIIQMIPNAKEWSS